MQGFLRPEGTIFRLLRLRNGNEMCKTRSSRRTGGEGHSSAARRSNARAVSVRGDEMRAAARRRRAMQLLPGPGAAAGMLPERRRWGTATRGGGRGQAPHPGLGAGSLEPECYVRNKARQARVRRGPGRGLPSPAEGPPQRGHEVLVLPQDGALPLDIGDHPLLGRPREAAD